MNSQIHFGLVEMLLSVAPQFFLHACRNFALNVPYSCVSALAEIINTMKPTLNFTQRRELVKNVRNVIESSELKNGIYILGSLQQGVTVYNQQVRAHNLVWALEHVQRKRKRRIKSIAVIGGGIGGLTLASLAGLRWSSATVTLFEQHSDLCPLQQGCDARWLHPHIYDWPKKGSRQPSAMLPVLNWREGRASDVASNILKAFHSICNFRPKSSGAQVHERINVRLDVTHLQIAPRKKKISWVGSSTKFVSGFFRKSKGAGQTDKFDLIFIATGFGRESVPEGYERRLYWQNDTLSQPGLTEELKTFIVSGSGDGALVDLFRLTIERYRQDRIVYEIFPSNLEVVEAELSARIERETKITNWYKLFDVFYKDKPYLKSAADELQKRIRKDTRVILHLAGRTGRTTCIEQALQNKSAVLNKLLLFLLYRCGGFIPSFDSLENAVKKFRPNWDDVICRYGTDAVTGLDLLFRSENADVRKQMSMRINELKKHTQIAKPLWRPGYFMPSPWR